MKSKRISIEMPTEEIPLLQEIAFIKNKQSIQNYINNLKTKEEQLFKEFKVICDILFHCYIIKLNILLLYIALLLILEKKSIINMSVLF
jgi:hypothetical protein